MWKGYIYQGKISVEGTERLLLMRRTGLSEWTLRLDGKPISNTISLSKPSTVTLSDGTKLELKRNSWSGRWDVSHDGVPIPEIPDNFQRSAQSARRTLASVGVPAMVAAFFLWLSWQTHAEEDRLLLNERNPVTNSLLTLTIIVAGTGIIWLACSAVSQRAPKIAFSIGGLVAIGCLVLAVIGLVNFGMLVLEQTAPANSMQAPARGGVMLGSLVQFVVGFAVGVSVARPCFKAAKASYGEDESGQADLRIT